MIRLCDIYSIPHFFGFCKMFRKKSDKNSPRTFRLRGEFYVWLPSVFVPSLTAVIQNSAIDRDSPQSTVKPEKESKHIDCVE